MSEDQFYRPDLRSSRTAEYTLAELRERERLVASIVANLKFIEAHGIDLEQLERRLASIASALKIIADDATTHELESGL